MTIRVLHHWACSGGTIISRAIASLPRVILLSEVHPLAHLRLESATREYAPTDVIQQLCLPHNDSDPALCVAAWNGCIDSLSLRLESESKILILRSHDHIDFFTGANCRMKSLISESLATRHRLLELLSVRHPLDSWISLKSQGWDKHFRFASLSEFSRRCLSLLTACEGMPFVRYEEFTLKPEIYLQLISNVLQLPDPTQARKELGSIALSGDSGRSGDTVNARPRRPIPYDVLKEIETELSVSNQLSHYQMLCGQLGYHNDPAATHPFIIENNQPTNLLQFLPQ